jgi:hypothetical protein
LDGALAQQRRPVPVDHALQHRPLAAGHRLVGALELRGPPGRRVERGRAGDQAEPVQDQRDGLLRGVHDRDDQAPLARMRRLEVGQLGVEHRGLEEVPGAAGHPLGDQRPVAVQEDQLDLGAAAGQQLAVRALERRAGRHAGGAGPGPSLDPAGDGAQPGQPVLVGERDPGAHLLDVGGRVEVVGLGVVPAQPAGQALADGRLAAAGHPDHQQDGRRIETGRSVHLSPSPRVFRRA